MKTVTQIDAEIADLKEWNNKPTVEKEVLDRLGFLTKAKYFLERAHQDTEEHLQRQLNDLKTKEEVIESGFGKWLDKMSSQHRMSEKEAKGKYRKEQGWKNLQDQIEMIEFLLKDVPVTSPSTT